MTILSGRERIVFDITNLDETVGSMGMSQKVTGRAISIMNKEKMNGVQKTWQERTAHRETLGDRCNTEEVKEEAMGEETSLTDVLNDYAKPLWVTARSNQL